MSLYSLSWKLWEQSVCSADPKQPCPVIPDKNLRPCSECCHCHNEAQDIENALEAAYAAGRANASQDVVMEWWEHGIPPFAHWWGK